MVWDQQRAPRWRSLTWWTSISGLMTAAGTLLAAASLVVATFAWLQPKSPTPTDSGSSATPTPTRARPGLLLRTPWLGLEFYRDDHRLPIYPAAPAVDADDPHAPVEVTIGDQPFEVRLPALGDDQAIGICAWTDASIFRKVVQDQAITERSPFIAGKGMADTSAGSGVLFLNDDAFNYFGGERVSRITDHQDAIYVSSIEAAGEDRQEAARSSVYLAIFLDRDSDNVTDNGEYEFVVLHR
jgi:hypothetical protein